MHFRPRIFRRARFILAAAILTLSISPLVGAQQSYKIIDEWKLGGEGGWDYLLVDSSAHRLYVTHGARVEVLDTETGKPAGAITGLHGTHGIALDDDAKLGYISDGGGNAVVVFDRTSLEKLATIPVGKNPDGIVYEPATKTVWAFNGRSNDVSVIDTAARTVIATIALPGKPEFPAVDAEGTVFVNIEDKDSLVRLDAKAKTLTATWPICKSPSGLAFDTAGHRLFSVCDGKKMAVTDSTTGQSLALPPIGDGPDAAAYSPANKLAFASCGEGVLSVINTGDPSYASIQTLPTQKGARTMAYDPGTDRIYLASAEYGPRPTPTAKNAHPRPPVVPGSFEIIVVGR